MRNILFIHAMLLFCLLCFVNCDRISETMQSIDEPAELYLSKPGKPQIATGTVEILWKGGGKQQQPEAKMAFAEFNAHAEFEHKPARGEFIFRVLNSDSTLHREVVVMVEHVYVDTPHDKAWFTGEVISDNRGCTGNGNGGHDSGCSGSSGCGGNHSGGGTSGGGGCSGHDGGHDDGCSGDDGGDHSTGCSGNGSNGGHGGSGGQGGQGSKCRVGQILAAKVHDVGTPGANGDGITWKWFDSDDPAVPIPPDANSINSWPHLCKKNIIGGNLSLHY